MNYRDRDWLYQKYAVEGLSRAQIGELCHCTASNIYLWMVKLNIPRRRSGVDHWSDEQKELRRIWNRAHPEISRMKGKHHSIETRIKMSSNRKHELNANWKGDEAKTRSGRERARRWFKEKQPCHFCGSIKTERHHKDHNTRNNSPSNIMWVCDLHHYRLHHKNGKR